MTVDLKALDALIEANIIGGTDDHPAINRAGLLGDLIEALPSTAGEPVAWRAPINSFGQLGFEYSETEQDLIDKGRHRREPLYALPPPPVAPQGRGEAERNAVVEALEKAAQVAEAYGRDIDPEAGEWIASKIRTLKETTNV